MSSQPGITLPSNTTAVTVNANGQVLAQIAGQQTPQTVGQLQLANFPNQAGLEAMGGNLLTETPASGAPTQGNPGTTAFGTIQQGYLETLERQHRHRDHQPHHRAARL